MTICLCMPIKESPDQSTPFGTCPANLVAFLFHALKSCKIKRAAEVGGADGRTGRRKNGEKKRKHVKLVKLEVKLFLIQEIIF